MRILLVANPRSRGGAAARRIPAAVAALEERASVVTIGADDTARAVAAHLRSDPWDRVVALGGDGTFARVADGILDAGVSVPLALLPAGLANNHARGLGLPSLFHGGGAIDAVFSDHRMQLDVGLLNGERFYDTVGFGFQAAALVRRERLRRLPLLGGELGYAVATGMEVARKHGFSATLVVDGQQVEWPRVLDVVVSNSVWYGGRWVLDRDARADDGLLEVVGVRGWRDLVRHGIADLDGGTADFRVRAASLRFDRAVGSQVDGEIGPVGRTFEVEMLPGALEVVRGMPGARFA